MSELHDDLTIHKVSVSLGFTKNLGDFNSLRADVSLEASGKGHPDATFNKVYDWVESKVAEKLAEAEATLKVGS